MTHFEIVGEDAQALQSFYKEAFDWEVIPAGPAFAMVHPQARTGIDGRIGGAPEGGGASRVTVYIEVDDLEAELGEIERVGGRRVMGPLDVPGGPSTALFSNPEGYAIGLTKAGTIRGR